MSAMKKTEELARRWRRLDALLDFPEAPDLDSGASLRQARIQARILSRTRQPRRPLVWDWSGPRLAPLAVAGVLLVGLALGFAAGPPVNSAKQPNLAPPGEREVGGFEEAVLSRWRTVTAPVTMAEVYASGLYQWEGSL